MPLDRSLPGHPETQNDMHFESTRAFVREILVAPFGRVWSIQGFGMLRLRITDAIRLNIWLKQYRVPNVSLMHTHPWNFASTILCGELTNHKYRQSVCNNPQQYDHAVIKPGPGGGLMEPLGAITLGIHRQDHLFAGQSYRQRAEEIHVSDPEDGCVTINYRTRVGNDVANVYWPLGTSWISAEPRKATEEEIYTFTASALAIWNKEY